MVAANTDRRQSEIVIFSERKYGLEGIASCIVAHYFGFILAFFFLTIVIGRLTTSPQMNLWAKSMLDWLELVWLYQISH